MNFVADVYIGCPHACWYCYAPSFVVRGSFEMSFKGFRNFRRRLKRDSDFEKIESAIKNGEVRGTCDREQEPFISAAIRHKHPLRIGSVSEPFGVPLENRYGDTYRILEIMVSNNYPFIVCTKSPLVATPRYLNLIKSADGKAGVQISLISLDESLLRCLESESGRATPSARSRLDALRKLSDEGIFTTCRIQPLIPQVTEDGMRELVYKLAEIGVNHIIVEFLWLPMGHAKNMSKKLKIAIDNYCNHGGRVGSELAKFDNDIYSYYMSFEDVEKAYGRIFFSRRKMAELMPKFAEMVREANREYNTHMTFGSGNEETSFLNFTENCCGVDNLPAFSGYSKCIGQTAFKIAQEKGKVRLGDVIKFYNPYVDEFSFLWTKREKKGYFLENRVFKLRARETREGVEYVYDDKAIPSCEY
ncbi:MAG: radical SAM protein [Thermoproteota archaeon]|nr:radical SAM protein [Candidatus Brockarchaeota archaeon]